MATESTEPELRRSIEDELYLRLLRVAFWISAAVDGLISLLGVLYGSMGLLVAKVIAGVPAKAGQQPPPEFLGWMFSIFGFLFFFAFAVQAALKARAAISLGKRQSRIYCLVVAGISCFNIPYGTILGICTFIVLGRDSVRALFDGNGVRSSESPPLSIPP